MAEWLETRRIAVECPAAACPDPSRVKRDGYQNGKQRYECGSCGKKFHADGQALNRQYRTRQIGAAIDKYLSGLSYKQVAEHMEDFHGVPEPSKRSVHDWVKSYTRLAKEIMDGKRGPDGGKETATGRPIKAKVGDVWVADETYIPTGGEWCYCWNVMDRDSRYLLATLLSANRGTREAIKVMEMALANADRPPKKVVTDGLESYPEAIRTVFPRGTVHEVSKGIHEEINNNISERLQGSIKDRTKTQRGLEGLRTGNDYLDAWTLDYNHFKPHETLDGKTPAQVAGVADQVPWGDSWEEVTRIGGEVAEPVVMETTITPNKSGPKPAESLRSAAEEYILAEQERKMLENAKARRRARNVQPVASYPRPGARKQGGRGQMRV